MGEGRVVANLTRLWATAGAPPAMPGRTILVDLIHGHPEYLYRSLVVAKLVQLVSGGRLVGLLGRPALVTKFVEVDEDRCRRLAAGFGVEDFLELPRDAGDPASPVGPELEELLRAGPDGKALASHEVEALLAVRDPRDGAPLGRSVQELYMRSELDARVRYGPKLLSWGRYALGLDAWARESAARLGACPVFVTGHADYQWGALAWHVLTIGGRMILFRLDDRVPVHLADTLPEAGTPNGAIRRGIGRVFAKLERRLEEDPVLRLHLGRRAAALQEAIDGGLGRHFRAVAGSVPAAPVRFDRSRPTFAAFAHTFTDQPAADEGLFPDHFCWLRETLRRAAQGGRFNLLVQAHPADGMYDRSGAFASLADEFSDVGNVAFTRASLSPGALLEGFDGGITVRGSPGVERTAEGLPMVLAGKGPYSECGFCLEPGTIDEYFALLEAGVPPDFDIELQRSRAQLYQGLDRFWGPPTTPLIRPYQVLAEDEAWWARVGDCVRGADLTTDPLLQSLARAWPCRDVPVSSVLFEAVLSDGS